MSAMIIPRLLFTALAMLLISVGSMTGGAAQTTDPKAPPAIAPMPATMDFYLARGQAEVCGPGCNEWIAAEGKIDPGAASRLRRLLAKLGKRRPPIFLNSPGGMIVGALELGRLIRDQKLEVSIAGTIPVGCNREKLFEQSCEMQKRSGQEPEAELDPTAAMCNSACVYALAAGIVRLVPPGVRLGIHDVGFDFATLPRGARVGEAKKVAHERIQEYLHEMGIDEALYRETLAIPFESKRYLERDELIRLRIDRREFGETAWQFFGGPPLAVSKGFFARTDRDPSPFLTAFVIVGCGTGQTVRMALARILSDSSDNKAASVGMSIDGHSIDLRYQVFSKNLDIHAMSLSAGTVEAFGDSTSLELFGTDFARGTDTERGVSLSMHGFSTAYTTLRKHCDEPPQKPVAGAAPGKPVSYVDDKLIEGLSAPARVGWPKTAAPALPAPAR